MKFGKFIKRAVVDVVVARNSHQATAEKDEEEFEKLSAVLFLNPEYAKKMGFKEGDVVEVESGGRAVRLKVMYSDTAPDEGAMMPNSIYSNYLSGDNLKMFKATISSSNLRPTSVKEILERFI
ncbi:Formylmethanofuran dehydrogenase subunit D [Archaeoglobus sulfaticallidus PM70-1]|uniref:Formylmethanofuran dehydrogenase subunit D n=1 Tax=Archaeoglobus sulfaticallidus PM70-1 TaxID=387631 RepID=N0BEV0_9EURY|nr:molybdopterin dinucleotide binding domain-containing protein [Archaeoglobus sulfaticallidus]AGK60802.1 Formylmethanofuran dehydrogenase subunit D [Archaeoglobus sulfaticallidus PM70-1]